jgi:hypothetical protein
MFLVEGACSANECTIRPPPGANWVFSRERVGASGVFFVGWGVSMTEPVYDDSRVERLVELLRFLAARIRELANDQDLLRAGPELIKLMGDARSELFHYEVRHTYDTPEVAENRRIVEQAQQQMDNLDFGNSEEDAEWQDE